MFTKQKFYNTLCSQNKIQNIFETLNGTSFNVMTMVEGLILQEIVLWCWSAPPFLRKLCFARGRKCHFSGSYGVRMT